MPPRDRIPDSAFIPRSTLPSVQPRPNPKLQRLNALFNKAGPVPPAPSRGPAVSAGAMESRMRMERLRGAREVEEIVAATDALLRYHHLPDDAELLCKMLVHPDAAVGETALAQLGAAQREGKLRVTTTMREALVAFEPRCREPLARALLAELLGSP